MVNGPPLFFAEPIRLPASPPASGTPIGSERAGRGRHRPPAKHPPDRDARGKAALAAGIVAAIPRIDSDRLAAQGAQASCSCTGRPDDTLSAIAGERHGTGGDRMRIFGPLAVAARP